jgi:hypothetical protein
MADNAKLDPLLFDLGQWDKATDRQRIDATTSLPPTVASDFEFVSLEQCQGQSGFRSIAVFTYNGKRFSLIPGGTTWLGFDAAKVGFDQSILLEEQERLMDDEDDDCDNDDEETPATVVKHFLDLAGRVTSAKRRITIAPLLVEQKSQSVRIPMTAADVQQRLLINGFSLLTEDEWEWCSSAGTGSLFRWGNQFPTVGEAQCEPPGQDDVELVRPDMLISNSFGLWIGDNPYWSEFCQNSVFLKGGDGGASWCGGEGALRIWLSLASCYRSRISEPVTACARRCWRLI